LSFIPNEHEGDILAELAIGADLSEEFRKQPTYYAHWAFLAARAADEVRKYEERADRVFAQLYTEFKKKQPEAKENDCKSYIRRNPEYRTIQQRLRRSNYNLDVLKSAVKAFEMKSSMLNQLGAQHRAELEIFDRGGPKTSEKQKDDRRQRKSNAVQSAYKIKKRRS